MRLDEIEKYQNIWYHGSGMDFDSFDTEAKRINRTTNPSGIYLTKKEDLARLYAQRGMEEQGKEYVYEVEIDVFNPFYENKSEVTRDMEEEYVKQLINKTTYQEEWVRKAILPDYIKTRNMKQDLPGDIKTAVMKAGGYDSYFMNDMGDNVIIVFDSDDITILNKFTPQELVKDPEYDDPIKKDEPKQKPKQKPKSEPTPKPADDDLLGQMASEFDM